MRRLFSTGAGKAASVLAVLATALLLVGAVWGKLTDSAQQHDLSIGCLRAAALLAAVALLLMLRHREALRARESTASGPSGG
ncbi:hypothetical protein ABZT04_00450 [Streptomyces sp. NPDC005492]|uniref:hypothetical protein n=1 Tax=Streptomyces sp. NPDC005492 TaxID=3156883 RepID=UPI0033A63647